jgi:hypothetical protein
MKITVITLIPIFIFFPIMQKHILKVIIYNPFFSVILKTDSHMLTIAVGVCRCTSGMGVIYMVKVRNGDGERLPKPSEPRMRTRIYDRG